MQHTAHGDKSTIVICSESSEQELDWLEAAHPKVFSEPTYPIWQNRLLF